MIDETPRLSAASIVSFAVDRWTDVPRCRHHVMARLAKRHRVLFTSPPWHVRDAWRGPGGGGTVARQADTLYTYTPPRWLPYTYRFPTLDRLSRRARTFALKRILGRLGMSRPIAYVWHPSFADMIGQLDEALLVYHCYDEYAAFSGADRSRVADDERRILEAADLVFTVSEGLCATKRLINPNTHVVRNGVDYGLFASACDPAMPIAGELRDLTGPIVGCVTRVVPEYFDAHLLHGIFSRRPDWSFVVVGPECAASRELDALKALPNVHMLGRRSFASLPSYVRGFDACLIPYTLTENKRLADPLKLYEYLAAGKPVVSKPLGSLAEFSDVVTCAEGVDEWIDAIESAMWLDSPDRRLRRQARAREHTWDNRVDTIERLIAGALGR